MLLCERMLVPQINSLIDSLISENERKLYVFHSPVSQYLSVLIHIVDRNHNERGWPLLYRAFEGPQI